MNQKALAVGGIAVGAVIFLLFLVAAFQVVTTVGDPPLIADPAPTEAPALLCPDGQDPSDEQTASGNETDQLACDPSEAVLAPQHRGAYDPNARLMALIGVLSPLLTTIVAFYFGQKAGAGQGEAEKQKVVSQVLAADPADAAQLTDLQERLRKQSKL